MQNAKCRMQKVAANSAFCILRSAFRYNRCPMSSVAAPPQELATNPLREGLDQERVPDASCLVIFGASGDLTQRKLIPCLYSLAHDGLLPAGQTIIGFARPNHTDDTFRAAMRESCDKHARTRPVDEAVWENFARGLFYVQGNFGEPDAYTRLKQRLEEFDRTRGTGGRRIYYLAVPPNFFPIISELLGAEGMVSDPERGGPYTRVIIEKPGNYFETAGISRDIIQNHMLQLVSLVAMEPSVAFEANAVRDEKVKVLRALREFPRGREEELAVRGQYIDGSVLGEKAIAYR